MRLLFCALIMLMSFSAFAQNQIGLTMGGSRFSGDVFSSYTRFEIGVFYRKNFANNFAVRSNVLYTTLAGDDNKASFSPQEINVRFRNLSFRSRVIEFNALLELYILKHSKKHSPYFLLGGGLFYFNPQAEYHGKWVNLQPLGTQGQDDNSKYKKLSPVIIAGLGYRYSVTENLTIGFELGYRFAQTDYLDDVSGTYADKSVMKSQEARDLSDRSGELKNDPIINLYVSQQGGFLSDPYSTNGSSNGSTPGYRINGYGTEGDVRGDKNKDNYIIYNLTVAYKFSR